MAGGNDNIEALVAGKYRHGFVTDKRDRAVEALLAQFAHKRCAGLSCPDNNDPRHGLPP